MMFGSILIGGISFLIGVILYLLVTEIIESLCADDEEDED